MTVTSAIIPASGLGKRLNELWRSEHSDASVAERSVAAEAPSQPPPQLNNNIDKAFVPIAGQPLLTHTLAAFQNSPDVDEIVLVMRHDQLAAARALVDQNCFHKVRAIVTGGETRQDSVRNGLAAVSPNTEIAAIHDGARPFVTAEIIKATIDAAIIDRAAIAAVPVVDTIKSSPDGRFVSTTLDRHTLYAVQTPQTFQLDLIRTAYAQAQADNYIGTDDASLVERLGIPVRIVRGSYENIKVTTPIDLAFAEAIMRTRSL